MANHFVILAPVSSSDSFSWRVVQSVGSKAWTREIRSRNLVSAAGPEVSSQWQTNSVPTSLEAGLAAFLTTQSLAPSSFTAASDVSPFVWVVRISSKEFTRAANAILKLRQKSSQSLEEVRGTTFGTFVATVFGTVFGAGGCFTR